MTNDEAINIIKSECYTANLLNLDRAQMVNTALDLAIKALEQQPCEDCISRQAVINRIANTCFWLSADNWKELIKCINSISTVTPITSQLVQTSI